MSKSTSEPPKSDTAEKIVLPPEIVDCVKQIDSLAMDRHLSGDKKQKLAQARLQVALWVCHKEKVKLTRAALAGILGPDTADVFANAEEMMLTLPWKSSEDRELTREIIKRRYPTVKTPKYDDYDL